jgi:hypothetical protein
MFLVTTLGARAAAAQSMPPTPAGEAPMPPTVNTATPAPGMVRMHFHTLRERDLANVYVRNTQGGYGFLCASPCTADVLPGAELRIVLDDGEDGRIFTVPNDLGSDVDVEVRAPGRGGGAIVMIVIGGVLALAGVVLVGLGTEHNGSDKSSLTAGLVCLGLGGGLGVGGILLLTNRSREPRVKSTPYRSHRASEGRGETALGDLTEGPRRDAQLVLPPSFTPLRLGFAF